MFRILQIQPTQQDPQTATYSLKRENTLVPLIRNDLDLY
jgi:hypothetical protein